MQIDFSNNHFELFHLPVTFDIDLPALDRAWRDVQREVHPDRFANATGVEQRLAARKITLDLDATAKAWLADEGYDPVFGARPLKRVIQRQLQDPLAEMLLAGEILDGSVIRVTAGTEGLIIGDRVVQSRRERPQSAVVH